LKDQAAGGRQRENGAKCAVEGLDFNAAVAREVLRGLEGEGERGRERKVVRAGERDNGGADGLGALAQQRDGRTGRRDNNGEGKGAAVVESDIRGEVVADLCGWHGGVGWQREANGIG